MFSRDCLVAFETNRYSVPLRLAGKRVEVLTDGEMIKIYNGGELISCHPQIEASYRSSIDKSHYWGLYKDAKPSPPPAEEVEVRDLAVYKSLLEGGAM